MRLRKMFRRKRAIIFEDLHRTAFPATASSFAAAKKDHGDDIATPGS
jgi:hypothetical protein